MKSCRADVEAKVNEYGKDIENRIRGMEKRN
jgi:hypothetical protein